MNILLTIPPSPQKKQIIRMIDCSHEAKANYLWQPNDYLLISGLARKEDTITLVDATADRLEETAFFSELRPLRPDLIFFLLSSVCWESDLAFFNRTKTLFPGIPIFVLGDIFWEENYRRAMTGDCTGIVYNPFLLDLDAMAAAAEHPGSSLPGVWNAASHAGLVEKKPATARDMLPRHELFLKKGYRFPFAKRFRFTTVTTAWGCPFTCSYCTVSKIPPVVRPWPDVVRELDRVRQLGIRELFMADKSFGYPDDNVFPLLDQMIRRFNFSWSCYFNPQLYDEELLSLMKAAGCHTMIIGIDSADVASLKNYRRTVDRKKIEELIIQANSLKISICADFILGLEHETEEDVKNTIEYALKSPIDFASFNIAAPLPGSDIRKSAIADGRMTFGQEGYDTYGSTGNLGNRNIDDTTIRKLRNEAVRRFYFRYSNLFRRLKRTSSLEHFAIQFLQMAAMLKKNR